MRSLLAPGAGPGAVQAGAKANPMSQRPLLPTYTAHHVEKKPNANVHAARDHKQALAAAASMGLALALQLTPTQPCLAAAASLEVDNSRGYVMLQRDNIENMMVDEFRRSLQRLSNDELAGLFQKMLLSRRLMDAGDMLDSSQPVPAQKKAVTSPLRPSSAPQLPSAPAVSSTSTDSSDSNSSSSIATNSSSSGVISRQSYFTRSPITVPSLEAPTPPTPTPQPKQQLSDIKDDEESDATRSLLDSLSLSSRGPAASKPLPSSSSQAPSQESKPATSSTSTAAGIQDRFMSFGEDLMSGLGTQLQAAQQGALEALSPSASTQATETPGVQGTSIQSREEQQQQAQQQQQVVSTSSAGTLVESDGGSDMFSSISQGWSQVTSMAAQAQSRAQSVAAGVASAANAVGSFGQDVAALTSDTRLQAVLGIAGVAGVVTAVAVGTGVFNEEEQQEAPAEPSSSSPSTSPASTTSSTTSQSAQAQPAQKEAVAAAPAVAAAAPVLAGVASTSGAAGAPRPAAGLDAAAKLQRLLDNGPDLYQPMLQPSSAGSPSPAQVLWQRQSPPLPTTPSQGPGVLWERSPVPPPLRPSGVMSSLQGTNSTASPEASLQAAVAQASGGVFSPPPDPWSLPRGSADAAAAAGSSDGASWKVDGSSSRSGSSSGYEAASQPSSLTGGSPWDS